MNNSNQQLRIPRNNNDSMNMMTDSQLLLNTSLQSFKEGKTALTSVRAEEVVRDRGELISDQYSHHFSDQESNSKPAFLQNPKNYIRDERLQTMKAPEQHPSSKPDIDFQKI